MKKINLFDTMYASMLYWNIQVEDKAMLESNLSAACGRGSKTLTKVGKLIILYMGHIVLDGDIMSLSLSLSL